MKDINYTPCFIDTETFEFKPGDMAPEIVCLQYKFPDCKAEIIIEPNIELQLIEMFDTVIDGTTVLIGHNIAYDMACICANYPDLMSLVFRAYRDNKISCTLAREKLYDTAIEGKIFKTKGYYSLAGIVNRRLGDVLEKGDEQTTFEMIKGIPLNAWPRAYTEYALNDVIKPPDINAVAGGTQYRMDLYTWESSTGNIEEWEIVVFFNGGVTTSKSLLTERAGLYGL